GPVALHHVRAGTGSVLAWAAGGFSLAILALLLALMVHTDIGLNVRHPETPVEPLIYVQTTPDVEALAREIHEVVDAGRADRVLIDDTEGAGITWPWAWYLRDLPVSYATPGELDEAIPDDAVVITLRDLTGRAEDAEVAPYRHRWWFPEEVYRNASWGSLWEGARTGHLFNVWAHFAVNHVPVSAVSSLDGQVLLPR
ncbi:MAG: hypothetical protein WD734_04740, partial [Dehalococcoidia bacterium]